MPSSSASSVSGGIFDVEALTAKLAEADEEAQDPEIWSDQDRAKKVMRRRSELQQQVATAEILSEAGDELEILAEMAREGDDGIDAELATTLKRLSPQLDRIELTAKMTGDHDTANAFIEIHPGAGGTESADWAADVAPVVSEMV